MAFWRSFFKILISILLVFTLTTSVFLLSFYQLTSKNVLKPAVSSYIEEQVTQGVLSADSQDILDLKAEIIQNCSGKSELTIKFGEYNPNSTIDLSELTINCSGVSPETNTTKMIQIVSEGVFNQVYYQTYDCNPVDCIINSQKNPENMASIISKQTNDFFLLMFLISLLISAILIVAIVLISKPKFTCFYDFSFAFLTSGIMFLIKFIAMPIIQGIEIEEPVLKILTFFLNSLFVNFLIVFVLGFIFLVLGIIFRSKYKV